MNKLYESKNNLPELKANSCKNEKLTPNYTTRSIVFDTYFFRNYCFFCCCFLFYKVEPNNFVWKTL